MKRTFFIGVAFLLSFFVASCSNDDVIENDYKTGQMVSLNAVVNNVDNLRLIYSDDNSKMAVAWSEGDKFTLYNGTNAGGSTFTNSANDKNLFKGERFVGEGPFYGVYGDNITNSGGKLSIDISNQIGTSAENGIKEFMVATASSLTNGATLKFNHKLTVLKLNLTLPNGASGTTVRKVTISGMHNKAIYDLSKAAYTYADENKGNIIATNGSAGFAISGNKAVAYVAVFPEAVLGGSVMIQAEVGSDTYYYTIVNSNTLPEGKVVPVNVSLTKPLLCTSSTTTEQLQAAINNGNLTIANDLSEGNESTSDKNFTALKKALAGSSNINLTFLEQITITEDALAGCEALKFVSAPKATEVGAYAFDGCTNLTSAYLPNVTLLYEDGFYECENLASVYLPKVETVWNYAFFRCSSLTTIDLPNVTKVIDCAFESCTSLTSVSLPRATDVPTSAFSGCITTNIELTVKAGTSWWNVLNWKKVTEVK